MRSLEIVFFFFTQYLDLFHIGNERRVESPIGDKLNAIRVCVRRTSFILPLELLIDSNSSTRRAIELLLSLHDSFLLTDHFLPLTDSFRICRGIAVVIVENRISQSKDLFASRARATRRAIQLCGRGPTAQQQQQQTVYNISSYTGNNRSIAAVERFY